MRVIAGTARGTKLTALPGEDVTRPTIARVKEAMFSALQFQLPGAKVLDLFAGSGQLGIEALSRGAEHCTFIDQDKGAIAIITANCRAAGVLSQARILQRESAAFAAANKGSYHVVLLDPPYRQGTLAKVLPDVARLTAPGGAVICESELEADLPDECGGLRKIKQHRYGTVLVTRYQKDWDE